MRYGSILMLVTAASIIAACSQSDETTAIPEKPVAEAVKLEEVAAPEYCGINAPQAGATFGRSGKLAVWGYAFDKETWAVPAAVTVRISSVDSDAKMIVPLVRSERGDVALALKRPELQNSGFGAEVDVTALQPGKYNVEILQEIRGKVYVCSNLEPITLE